MFKQVTPNASATQFAEATLAVSRQAWLAGLGAASAARNWARNGASDTFYSLVRQGSSVETRVIQAVGERMETSLTTAAALVRRTRGSAARAARAIAQTATMLIPALRRTGPGVRAHAHKRASVKAKGPIKARATGPSRRSKHAAKKTRRAS